MAYRSSEGGDNINSRLSPDSRALTCQGEIVDSLLSSSSLFQFAKDPMDWTEMEPWFTETEAMITRAIAVTSGDSALPEVHYRTLVANQANVLDFDIDSYYAFKECIQSREADESTPRRTALAFITAMSYPAMGRKYCITKDETVGLVPSDAREGDEICVFLGLVVPYVIRKVPGTDNDYLLVGECYLDGLVDNDALVRESSRVRDIVLV